MTLLRTYTPLRRSELDEEISIALNSAGFKRVNIDEDDDDGGTVINRIVNYYYYYYYYYYTVCNAC